MTKTEAFQLSAQTGQAITHRYFSDDEWIVIENGVIRTEEGYSFPFWEFMQDRQGPEWQDDWSIYN